jgi:hypothetical protein
MIISQLQFAAMRRVDIPESERRDFYVYADEFQKFATDSFATILSEARKYRLNLVLTHQYIEQMPEAVREAIFGNVGSLMSFTVGPGDAAFLEKEFEPTFLAQDIINLGRYEMYLKLQVEDMSSPPFSARSLPPRADRTGSREEAIRLSRSQYSRRVEVVEEKIRRWAETHFHPGMSVAAQMVQPSVGPAEPETQVTEPVFQTQEPRQPEVASANPTPASSPLIGDINFDEDDD